MSKTEKYVFFKSTKPVCDDITLKLLYDGSLDTIDNDVILKHFRHAKMSGRRSRVRVPTILDVKEVLALKYLGDYTPKQMHDISIWLNAEELMNDCSLNRLKGEVPLVVITSKHAYEEFLWVSRHYELTNGRKGQCKFFGKTQFAPAGKWVGLALWEGKGKHDGSIDGKYYFRCKKGKGVFVRPYEIIQEVDIEEIGLEVKNMIALENLENIKNKLFSGYPWEQLHKHKESWQGSSSEQEKENQICKPHSSDTDHMLQAKLFLEHSSEQQDDKMSVKEFEEWVNSQSCWQKGQIKVTKNHQPSEPLHRANRPNLHKSEHKSTDLDLGETDFEVNFNEAPDKFEGEGTQYDLPYLLSKLRRIDRNVEYEQDSLDVGLPDEANIVRYELDLDEVGCDLSYKKKRGHYNNRTHMANKQGPDGRTIDNYLEGDCELTLDDIQDNVNDLPEHLYHSHERNPEHQSKVSSPCHSFSMAQLEEGMIINTRRGSNKLTRLHTKDRKRKAGENEENKSLNKMLHPNILDGKASSPIGTFQMTLTPNRSTSPRSSLTSILSSCSPASSCSTRRFKETPTTSTSCCLRLDDFADTYSDSGE